MCSVAPNAATRRPVVQTFQTTHVVGTGAVGPHPFRRHHRARRDRAQTYRVRVTDPLPANAGLHGSALDCRSRLPAGSPPASPTQPHPRRQPDDHWLLGETSGTVGVHLAPVQQTATLIAEAQRNKRSARRAPQRATPAVTYPGARTNQHRAGVVPLLAVPGPNVLVGGLVHDHHPRREDHRVSAAATRPEQQSTGPQRPAERQSHSGQFYFGVRPGMVTRPDHKEEHPPRAYATASGTRFVGTLQLGRHEALRSTARSRREHAIGARRRSPTWATWRVGGDRLRVLAGAPTLRAINARPRRDRRYDPKPRLTLGPGAVPTLPGEPGAPDARNTPPRTASSRQQQEPEKTAGR